MRALVLAVVACGGCASGGYGLVHLEHKGIATANFPAARPQPVAAAGACKLQPIAEPDPNTNPASAGTITVAGTAQPITLGPDASGRYRAQKALGALWSGGEALDVQASGGEVPAFRARLTAPRPLALAEPAALGRVVPRDADYVLRWTPGDGELRADFLSTAARQVVVCRFDASAGQGVVPSALLSRLPAGAGFYALRSQRAQTLTAGRWTVDVEAVDYLEENRADFK